MALGTFLAPALVGLLLAGGQGVQAQGVDGGAEGTLLPELHGWKRLIF